MEAQKPEGGDGLEARERGRDAVARAGRSATSFGGGEAVDREGPRGRQRMGMVEVGDGGMACTEEGIVWVVEGNKVGEGKLTKEGENRSWKLSRSAHGPSRLAFHSDSRRHECLSVQERGRYSAYLHRRR